MWLGVHSHAQACLNLLWGDFGWSGDCITTLKNSLESKIKSVFFSMHYTQFLVFGQGIRGSSYSLFFFHLFSVRPLLRESLVNDFSFFNIVKQNAIIVYFWNILLTVLKFLLKAFIFAFH